jgi:hypothetical protein
MLSGAGFPMHRDLDVVYCTSPIELQISRHTLPALVLCSPHLPENSSTYYLAPSIGCRWYQAPPSAGGIGCDDQPPYLYQHWCYARPTYQRTVVPMS